MFRWSVLLLALALSTPALWSALAVGTMSVTVAAVRFLIAVPVAGVMLAVLRYATAERSAALAPEVVQTDQRVK